MLSNEATRGEAIRPHLADGSSTGHIDGATTWRMLLLYGAGDGNEAVRTRWSLGATSNMGF